jgi:hypothetical protein
MQLFQLFANRQMSVIPRTFYELIIFEMHKILLTGQKNLRYEYLVMVKKTPIRGQGEKTMKGPLKLLRSGKIKGLVTIWARIYEWFEGPIYLVIDEISLQGEKGSHPLLLQPPGSPGWQPRPGCLPGGTRQCLWQEGRSGFPHDGRGQ